MGLLSTIGAASGRAFGLTRVGVLKDLYFNLTTLLLPGNGTNGAQNNTFTDSSSNNFSITRNPSTGPNAPTQGTFSPFSQTGWSNYFDGSSSYLSSAANAKFGFGTGTYSIEAWVFKTTTGTYKGIFGNGPIASGSFAFYVSNTETLVVDQYGSTSIATTATIPVGVWTHVLATKDSATNGVRVFIDGVLRAYSTSTFNNTSTNCIVGLTYTNDTAYMVGYLSNVRVIKGSIPTGYQTSSTTVGTSIFTPPTSALTTSSQGATASDVSLLTCQSNRFIDNSSNAFAITVNGSPSVQAFSPFLPTAAYDAATVGGSGYFDGTGDYLSVADNANLRLGTSAFTIQAWIYRAASGTAHSIIAKGGASTGFVFQVTSGNVLRFTHGTTNVDTTTTIPASSWTHVAAVRTGTGTNGFQLYINGVSSVTATVATDFNQTDTLYVGADRSAATTMNGYISGLKYTNGTAESISVPTSPPTATTNVALLTNYTNAGITDATAKNDLETVGTAQISTAQSKFGGSSIYIPGTATNYVKCATSANLFDIAGADFTIEFWVRFDSVAANRSFVSKYGNSAETAGDLGYNLEWLQSTNQLRLVLGKGTGAGDALYTWSWTPSTGIWYHVAVTRSGTSGRAFVDGAQIGSTLTVITNDVASPNSVIIGKTHTVAQYMNGYMSGIRITKGFARYTSAFTAPTAAFPLQ